MHPIDAARREALTGAQRGAAAGAEDEVRRAEALGPSHTARKALGFSQLLAGDVEDMKKRSRNYARRQMTWMRKMPEVRRLDMGELSAADAAEEIAGVLEGAGATTRG